MEQLIKIMETKKQYFPANGCVISLPDTYSQHALQKADDAGIKLIKWNGVL